MASGLLKINVVKTAIDTVLEKAETINGDLGLSKTIGAWFGLT